MPPIWFMFGLSGAGKSALSNYLAVERHWLHLEIDLHPLDGIDEHHLRPEWNQFYNHRDHAPLTETLAVRCANANSNGVVLSFPGNLISAITPEHVAACGNVVRFIFLSGAPEFCLNSFLTREAQTGRGLGPQHWRENNQMLYYHLARVAFRRQAIDVFYENGDRKSFETICNEIEAH